MRELVDGDENERLDKTQRYQARRLCGSGERAYREIERIVGRRPRTRSIRDRTKLHAEQEQILTRFGLRDSIALKTLLADHGEPLVHRREVGIAECLIIVFWDKGSSCLLQQRLARRVQGIAALNRRKCLRIEEIREREFLIRCREMQRRTVWSGSFWNRSDCAWILALLSKSGALEEDREQSPQGMEKTVHLSVHSRVCTQEHSGHIVSCYACSARGQ